MIRYMTNFGSRQGEFTPDPILRLTPEGAVAVRAYFASKVEQFTGLGDYYAQRFGPDNLIDTLTPQEEAGARSYLSPADTPIVAEQVRPTLILGCSFDGGW